MATRRSWAAPAPWFSDVVTWTSGDATTTNSSEATAITIIVTLTTAETASHASSSERVVRRSTNTGTNVADRIPPRTTSWTMLGIVLARL